MALSLAVMPRLGRSLAAVALAAVIVAAAAVRAAALAVQEPPASPQVRAPAIRVLRRIEEHGRVDAVPPQRADDVEAVASGRMSRADLVIARQCYGSQCAGASGRAP